MDKKTIWAIVLCALVLVVSVAIETTFVIPKQQQRMEQQALEQAEYEQQLALEQEEKSSLISSVKTENVEESTTANLVETEETFTIRTNKAEVVFTNRGGDIISYKLLEHLDKDTGEGVEMVDNVTSTNRAFAVSFGDYNAQAVNEIFKVKRLDDYTIGFFRDYYIKNSAGVEEKVTLSKLYSFMEDEYAFKLDVGIESANGLNIDGNSYTIRTSPQIGPHYDQKTNRYEVREYLSLNGNKKTRKTINDKVMSKEYDWAGVGGKYFTILVKPENSSLMTPGVKCSTKSESDYMNSQVFLTRSAISNTKNVDTYYIYVGPRSERELIKYNSTEKNNWGLINAKFNQALKTSGILSFIEIALKWCLEMIYKLVKNYGVSIIVLTVLLKLVLFPLNKKSAMGSIKMQEIQPKMQALQEKYKDDQQKLSVEMQKLYKEAGYNPASGCLPMILQMLILISLYNVFNNYFDFRGVSFIPGWIDDLTVGDSIWSWDKQIFFISGLTQNSIRILPVIYLISQLLNGMITQYGGAGATGQSAGMMKFMMYGMPILMFFMFYNVPSGLLIYWVTSNILQIGQQVVINKLTKKKRVEAKLEVVSTKSKNAEKFKGGKKKSR